MRRALDPGIAVLIPDVLPPKSSRVRARRKPDGASAGGVMRKVGWVSNGAKRGPGRFAFGRPRPSGQRRAEGLCQTTAVSFSTPPDSPAGPHRPPRRPDLPVRGWRDGREARRRILRLQPVTHDLEPWAPGDRGRARQSWDSLALEPEVRRAPGGRQGARSFNPTALASAPCRSSYVTKCFIPSVTAVAT